MKVQARTLLVGLCIAALSLCSSAGFFPAAAEQITVGQVSINEVWVEYERAADLEARVDEARQELLAMQQEAQDPEANPEEIQEQMRTFQAEVQAEIDAEQKQIRADIDAAVAQVAQQADLSLIITSALYRGSDVNIVDLTESVHELLSKQHEEQTSSS